MKQETKVVIYSNSLYGGALPDVQTPLADTIDWLTQRLKEIPEEYRASARLEIDSETEYDSTHAIVEISYCRPETDAETAVRENNAQAQVANEERNLLARLEQIRARKSRS